MNKINNNDIDIALPKQLKKTENKLKIHSNH